MWELYPHKIVLGSDAKDGQVATDGWLQVSERRALDLARHCERWPLAALVYTDISRDGMLLGPNLDTMAELAATVQLPIVASGGVTTLKEVRRLERLNLEDLIFRNR